MVRICRVFKLGIVCGIFLFVDQKTFGIILVILNCFDFLVINTQFTFIKTEIEQSLMLASINCLLSIAVKEIITHNLGIYQFLSELCLIGFYFLMEHPLQIVIELKYLMYFNTLDLTKNDDSQ